ncbi:BLUF domain-containing protein [Sphingomonas sp. RS2018]
MMISRLLYISDARISFDRQVADIVERSRLWNARVEITGALVRTDRHFVQFIEGPAEFVDDMARKLACDNRHANMRIIDTGIDDRRRFSKWSLAYSGPDDFIDQRLVDLVTVDTGKDIGVIAHHLTSSLVGMATYG